MLSLLSIKVDQRKLQWEKTLEILLSLVMMGLVREYCFLNDAYVLIMSN